MISKEMQELLQKQINMELYSGYLYLDMANFYAEAGLDGFAHWYEVQAQEEFDHAMLFRGYCINNDVPVVFNALAKPHLTYKEYIDPLMGALEHEKEITASIVRMYDLAVEQKDYRTIQILDWFIAEQDEEETNAIGNIQKFEIFAKDGKGGLYALNKEMGAREHHAPDFEV